MEHPPEAFIKAHYAEYPLDELVSEWLAELEARPVSVNTVGMYSRSTSSFCKSLRQNGKNGVLSDLTVTNVTRWKLDMRQGKIPADTRDRPHNSWVNRPVKPYSEATVQSYLIVLKVFSGGWVRRRFSVGDLLDLVQLGKTPQSLKPGMSPKDIEALLAACDSSTFEMIRLRAFLQVMLATALRFNSVWSMSMSRLDVEQKRAWVLCKGNRMEPVDIDGKAMRDLRVYLGRRRQVVQPGEQAVWVKEGGEPIGYDGAHAAFTRLEQVTGIKCNPHRFRHTVAQAAAKAGAPVADIQDLLKHKSDRVSRMYIGEARQDVAAALGPKYSLAG